MPANDDVVQRSSMRKAISRTVHAASRRFPNSVSPCRWRWPRRCGRRTTLKAAGKAVSLNDLILFATARTLVAHPDLNSLLEGDSLRRREINIGFALGN